jgi:hypothetical protein
MKVEILMNGTTKIVLLPENDIEKAILDSMSKNEVDAIMIKQQTHILDKVIQEALVISTKKTQSAVNVVKTEIETHATN